MGAEAQAKYQKDFQNSLIETAVDKCMITYEPRSEKTGLRGFRPGPTQTGLYSSRRWLEACNFGFRK